MEFQIVKSYTNHNHLSIGLPLLASKVDEGSDLVYSAVGQCNGVDRVVGNGHWGVVDKGGVVDDRGNMMEDRVGDHLVAHLFNKEMLSKFILGMA